MTTPVPQLEDRVAKLEQGLARAVLELCVPSPEHYRDAPDRERIGILKDRIEALTNAFAGELRDCTD